MTRIMHQNALFTPHFGPVSDFLFVSRNSAYHDTRIIYLIYVAMMIRAYQVFLELFHGEGEDRLYYGVYWPRITIFGRQ